MDAQGVGPARLGDAVETIGALDGWSITDPCTWAAFGPWTGDGRWIVAASSSDDPSGAVQTVDFGGGDAGSGPRTPDGLGLGSTRAEILAAHPEATEGDSNGYAWIRVGQPAPAAGIYLSIRGDSTGVSRVTVTSENRLSPEFCG